MSAPYYPRQYDYNRGYRGDPRYADQRRYYNDRGYTTGGYDNRGGGGGGGSSSYYGSRNTGGSRGNTGGGMGGGGYSNNRNRFSRDREDRKDEYYYRSGGGGGGQGQASQRDRNQGYYQNYKGGSGSGRSNNYSNYQGGGGGDRRQGGGGMGGRRMGGGGNRYGNSGGGRYGNYGSYGGGHGRSGGGSYGPDFSGILGTNRTKKVDNFDYEADDWKDKISMPKQDTRVKTEDVTQTKGSNFEDFHLKRKLLRAIYELGFEKPSPVQEESIPNIMMRNNVLARAKNGTGKTAAYAIPILQLIDASKKYIQALILVPTRELALQTAKVVKDLCKYLDVEVLCTTGGMSLRNDIIRLDHGVVHVVVATPGRILDLSRTGHAKLQKCGIVSIDEADKLLSPDFSNLIEKILQYIPQKQKDSQGDDFDRQLLLYSATFPVQVASFCQTWLPTRKEVNLMDDLTLKGITQYYAYLNEEEKVHALYSLINKLKISQCVIFAKSVARVELLARKVTKLGFSCFYIHSRMDQKDRNRVFHEFRQGPNKCRFLVCTDLITRGVDVPTVNVVINFDFPKTGETYLHRIGRGGRFGHLSLAINFVTDLDRDRLYQVEHHLQTEIKPIPNDVEKIDSALYFQ